MRKIIYLFILIGTCYSANAAVGDTTWVYANNTNLDSYGNYDSTVVFPNGATSYRKIYMIMTLGQHNCSAGTQYCHQWDYDLENYIMTPGGDTLEMTRFITPYATSGTPGFGPSWKQHYIFDVTDYYNILKDTGTVRLHYSGYSGGFTINVKFAFIEGTPERNVIGYNKLWYGGYSYGNISNVIDSNVKAYALTAPAGIQSAEMKLAITGHGYDNATGCCEFDNTGVGHTYTVVANNNIVAQKNMNINCGAMELYPQGGTWASARNGNWCPGGLVEVAQHKLPGVTAGNPYTVDLNFDDSYNGGGSYGDYNIAASVFYYGAYNKTLDASLEDIAAPTTFEWYRRENPQVSKPIVKVRNTGSTTITSILFQYGVQDSALSQYVWVGSLAPSADTTITFPALPALTNLSLNYATGNYNFEADIVKVNGATDDDASNNTLTSTFAVAPTWPPNFAVNMRTSSVDINGNPGSSSPSLSDASWQVTDQNNVVVASRSGTTVQTQYRDTLDLIPGGFYQLTVNTAQCVGLHWWVFEQPAPNNTPGYSAGTINVTDVNTQATLTLNGNNIGLYHDDFGCGFTQYFTTSGECQTNVPVITRLGDTLVASTAPAYQWYYDGYPITGATGATYGIQHNNGNYAVFVDYGNGCTNMSASYAIVNLAVNDLSDLSSVTVAPNPAKDAFIINASVELAGSSYVLSDLMGREVLTGRISGEATRVSVSGLSSGLYLLNIGAFNKQSFKIVKD